MAKQNAVEESLVAYFSSAEESLSVLKETQPANADAPSVVRESGSTAAVKAVSEKALSPISLSPSLKLILLRIAAL